ncbi:MAG: DNA-3-methyladenine glycosylase 2 family protein [Chloroflexota bacterium]|nr:MAG: DNA-3-methyladenine glycosylase 2 family protein [Chloroflexota bacterium]
MMKLEIAAKPPFSLHSVIHSHGWARLAPFNLDDETGEFSYVLELENQRVLKLIIEEIPDGVSVEIEDPISKVEANEISEAVAWMLGLDQDFSEFYELARGESKLEHIEREAQGRILRSPTLFEDTIKTILTTNTAWSGTIRMANTLVTQFGEAIPGDDTAKAFPNPDTIAESDEKTLREETRLGYRSSYILNLAREVNSGTFDLETLKDSDLPVEKVRDSLLSIKGVGNYAVANLLMLLGHYSYLTIDSWALKMVSHEWYGGEPVTPTEVEQAFEKWGDWKGLAYWLWDWSYDGE